MSFLQYRSTASDGDLVIVCRGREKMTPVLLKRDSICQTKGGAIAHNDIIGKEFGERVYTTNGKSWVTILSPSPELWTVTLPHRTQILYSTDISIITLQLELRPGSVVCECGTGSGSLSHAIVRTIAPAGHLYTYDFHEQRTELVKKEFAAHGLSDFVSVECRDVCKDGFGLASTVDAVFLDLPKPWEAIDSAKEAIKTKGGRLCSFSPCIEQVQRTCEVMDCVGFTDIDVMECLQRPFDVRPCVINVPSTGVPSSAEGEGQSEESQRNIKPIASSVDIYTCAPHRSIPGHTGFLVFGTLLDKSCISS